MKVLVLVLGLMQGDGVGSGLVQGGDVGSRLEDGCLLVSSWELLRAPSIIAGAPSKQ